MPEPISFEVTTPLGVPVEHQLLAHDAPKGLLVILPGRGYTCDFPVLHYLRKAAYDLGLDVLSVWYGFQVAPNALVSRNMKMEQLVAEVERVMDQVLKRGYRRLCLAGKSLGTPLAVMQAQLHPVERLILLTPIGTSVQDAGRLPTLAVIGTADPYYKPDLVNAADVNTRWLVLDGLDHGLEAAGDWSASLDALTRITAACVDFLL